MLLPLAYDNASSVSGLGEKCQLVDFLTFLSYFFINRMASGKG